MLSYVELAIFLWVIINQFYVLFISSPFFIMAKRKKYTLTENKLYFVCLRGKFNHLNISSHHFYFTTFFRDAMSSFKGGEYGFIRCASIIVNRFLWWQLMIIVKWIVDCNCPVVLDDGIWQRRRYFKSHQSNDSSSNWNVNQTLNRA